MIGRPKSSKPTDLSTALGRLFEGETVTIQVPARTTRANGRLIPGALVLTDQRILFDGHFLFETARHSIALSHVTDMGYSSAFGPKVSVTQSVKATEWEITDREAASRFIETLYAIVEPRITARRLAAEAVEDAAALAESAQGAEAQTLVAPFSVADELAKFAALHAQSMLTDDEWAAKKADLLARP